LTLLTQNVVQFAKKRVDQGSGHFELFYDVRLFPAVYGHQVGQVGFKQEIPKVPQNKIS